MKETEISTKKTTTITLPVELIKEIFSYLPAKTLLKWSKLVCKPCWLSFVIKEPHFIKMHLNRGAINGGRLGSNNYQSLMCNSTGKLFRFQLPFNFQDIHPPNSTVLTIKPTKVDVDSSLFRHWRTELVCSCNGLLCIDTGLESLILLNPCTSEHKFSPKEPLRDKSMAVTYGFGCFYDSTITTTTAAADGHYKVVRIEHTLPSKSEVKVYSLDTNSWRTIQDISDNILEMITKTTDSQSGVFLNEALHWMNHQTADIVSIDMRSEEFQIMPRTPDDGNRDIKVLMIMRGCLGMIRIDSLDLEISIMKEYGVSTWTREIVIRLSTSNVGFYGLSSILWLDDQILFEEIGRSGLVVYDMNKKMSVYIGIQNPKCGTHLQVCLKVMIPCIESLVLLKSSQLITLSKDKKRRVETIDTEIKE